MIPNTIPHLRCWLLALLMLGAASPAIAQATSIRASLSATELYAGDQIQLSVDIINGSDTTRAPTTPEIPGCRVTFAGRSSSTQMRTDIRNGRRVTTNETTISYRYLIMPTRTGEFVVPPVSIATADGRVLRTEPTSFRAVATPPSESASLELSVDATRAFVGEPVRLRFTLTLPAANVRGVEFGELATLGAAELKAPPDPRSDANARGEFVEFNLWGEPAVGELGSVLAGNGTQRRTLTVDRLVLPTSAATLTLGPTTAYFEEAVGTRRGQGLFMRDQTVYERRQVTADPVSIEVQPLPPSPSGSVPVVGPIDLTASLSATQLGIGDPATLSIVVTGEEPLDRVQLPDLSEDPALTDSFRFDTGGWKVTESSPGSRRYELPFRVASPEVSSIGPVEITYFDPTDGAYRVASTGTLPIDLRRTRVVTAGDAVTSNSLPSRRDPLVAVGGGPIANHSELGRRPRGSPASVLMTAPGLVAVSAPPLLAAACLLIARRRDTPDTAASRRARAFREAKRALRKGTDPTAVARRFVADAADMPIQSVTARDAQRLGEIARTSLAPLIATSESRRIGTTTADSPSASDVLRVLHDIATENHQ